LYHVSNHAVLKQHKHYTYILWKDRNNPIKYLNIQLESDFHSSLPLLNTSLLHHIRMSGVSTSLSIKVVYPEVLGTLQDAELDSLLKDLQQVMYP